MTSHEIRYIYNHQECLNKTFWYVQDQGTAAILKELGLKKIRSYRSNSPAFSGRDLVNEGYELYQIF
jgi:hypothetical protein